MRKRIIFVDYISKNDSHNHINNQIIKQYSKNNTCDLYVNEEVLHHYEFNHMDITIHKIKSKKIFSERVRYILTVISLLKIRHNKDDCYIFLSYDNIAQIFFSRIRKTILINHNNLSHLNSPLKFYFFKFFFKNFEHVVFNQSSFELLSKLKFHKIRLLEHSIPKRIKQKRKNYDSNITLIAKNNQDLNVIKTLFEDKSFVRLVNSHKVKLRSRLYFEVQDNLEITFYLNRLSGFEYNQFLIDSDVVLLFYDKAFKYRISNILLECISNNITVYLLKNKNVLDDPTIALHTNIKYFENKNELLGLLYEYFTKKEVQN